MPDPRTAIIVGGGIAGLTTAIALRRLGMRVAVYERTPEIREVGAGLPLWGNAMQALQRLGLARAVQGAGMAGLGGTIQTWDGRPLATVSAADLEAALGAANVGIHRADLQRVLVEAVGPDALRLGAACVGCSQDEKSVMVRFADGRIDRADMLIAADGIYSVVRTQLFDKHKPRYAGYTAWRGVATLDEPALPADTAFESWGRGQRFGMVRIGGRRVYWFATHNAPEGRADAADGRQAELLRLFGGWHAPIPALLRATDPAAILRNDIIDREPLPRWSNGRVTLVGDAAHPMTPNLGQGACQAIEDAVALADCLAQRDDTAAALLCYELHRSQRANLIVRQSWRIGRVAQWQNPALCAVRDAAVRALGPGAQLRQLRFTLGVEA